MVTGFDVFREAMSQFADNFVVIGGTACDVSLANTGRTRHATKDIDIIVIVENLTAEFINAFWRFIKQAGYRIGKRENSVGNSVYALYRFNRPEREGYPWQIELLARQSDLLDDSALKIEPLKLEDSQYCLSAIVMDDDLYHFVVQHSESREGLRMADEYALVCMKMVAYQNMKQDKELGLSVDENDIKKHRRDVFNLLATGKMNDSVSVCKSIYDTYRDFIGNMTELHAGNPNVLAQSLGVNPMLIEGYFELLETIFILEK